MGGHESIQSPLLGIHKNVKNTSFIKVSVFLLALFTLTILGIALGTSRASWLVITGPKYNGKNQARNPEVVVSSKGVVAADDGRCSEVGVSILRQDGHAVDAAVATALCVGVVNPMASGIGGGAFMVVRSALTSQALAFDMRETAPLAASKVLY